MHLSYGTIGLMKSNLVLVLIASFKSKLKTYLFRILIISNIIIITINYDISYISFKIHLITDLP